MPHWLVQRAALTPHREALVFGGERWTFAMLAERVIAIACQLASQGVGAGQHVALLMGGSDQFVTLIHALSRLHAVLFPLNIRLTSPELTWQVQQGNISLLISDINHFKAAQAIQAALPQLKVLLVDDLNPHTRPVNDYPLADTINLDEPFGVLYTSGTTGKPKGAVITYGNMWWSAIGSSLNMGNVSTDRWLACMPLFHIGGLSILMRSVIYGIPVHLHTRFDADAVNLAIDTEDITIISVVSNMLQRMLTARGHRPFPMSLRCVLIGGGPVPYPLLETCMRLNVPVTQTYGLTETASQIATLAPEDALRKPGSAGKPLFPNEICIQNAGSVVAAGEIGEIVVRGPSVTPGYLQSGQQRLNPATDNDGWLHTGDLGYIDEGGYLYVKDRRDDLIVSGGENVYPAEIEAVLLAHPAIAEVGVTGAQNEQWGQVPIAFVVISTGTTVTRDELQLFCRQHLATYKVPQQYFSVSTLPRTASGKLQRNLLRQIKTDPIQ